MMTQFVNTNAHKSYDFRDVYNSGTFLSAHAEFSDTSILFVQDSDCFSTVPTSAQVPCSPQLKITNPKAH